MSDDTAHWAARFWTVSYSPLRAFWFMRGLYALLAADLWFDMVEHGGRYGVGGFNVAHFAWLDLLLPLPSAALYVGLLIVAGFIALWLSIGQAPRWLRGLLALVYTASWMLSVHDSYQHHYLLSWLLVWCVGLPDVSARFALSTQRVRGWGLPMSAVTCSIVYCFTGIAKSEPEWRGGAALRSLTRSAPLGAAHPGKFDGARDLLLSLGLTDASVWHLFALATIALQWTVALGYLASTQRDERPTRARLYLCAIGLFGALSFHALAELFHVFEIGLFSYYMMFVALVLLGPVGPWRHPTAAVAWLGERLEHAVVGPDEQLRLRADGSRSPTSSAPRELLRPLLSAALLLSAGFVIPLPGALGATCAASLIVVIRALVARRASSATLDALALESTFATCLLWFSLTQTSVPFDYYRRTAGELYRMGQLEQALSLYELAQRYAPADESRATTIRELKLELEQRAAKRSHQWSGSP